MNRFVCVIFFLCFGAFASAASVTISNPQGTSSSGGTTSNLFVNSFENSSPGEVEADFASVNNSQLFDIQFDLISTDSGQLSFDVNLNNFSSWSVSLINTTTSNVLSGGNSTGFSSVSIPASYVEANTLYNIVIEGTANVSPVSRFLEVRLNDINVVSEVPLPAAVWLFGSALLGGLALRRKRQQSSVAATA